MQVTKGVTWMQGWERNKERRHVRCKCVIHISSFLYVVFPFAGFCIAKKHLQGVKLGQFQGKLWSQCSAREIGALVCFTRIGEPGTSSSQQQPPMTYSCCPFDRVVVGMLHFKRWNYWDHLACWVLRSVLMVAQVILKLCVALGVYLWYLMVRSTPNFLELLESNSI